MRRLRLALAQINSTVGDLAGNADKILAQIERARALEAQVVAFPELAITGYPPEDLLLKPQFIRDNQAQLDRVAAGCQGITAIVGFVDANSDIYNSAAIIHDGEIVHVYHKNYLPNYGVFDEDRYFQSGTDCPIYVVDGVTVGVNICEDIWYPAGPTTSQAHAGAEVIINISSSPYYMGKRLFRQKMLATRAMDNAVIVAYVNMVGGQDELVFDGDSMVFDQEGTQIAQARQFAEDLVVLDLDVESVFRSRLHDPRLRKERLSFELSGEPGCPTLFISDAPAEAPITPPGPCMADCFDPVAEVYHALVLGTRDYARKNGFTKVLIGLSGGIDSSLTATVAADALGPESVVGVSMPSRFSSEGSKDDAKELAENLGIKYLVVPIEKGFEAMLEMLAPAFEGTQPNIAEENLQARMRGNILMGISNKFGHLVLTTGNKSEVATGYCTLYGDMAGGFAVIKDVPKTLVYDLCRYRNSLGEKPVIPEAVLTKPPSAELRPDQKDTDSLPPYDLLDPVLVAYAEEDRSVEEMVGMGVDRKLAERVVSLVDRSEYKRRQAPPGIKITARAFGRDRRLPITNRYRGF